ncbi:DsbA family protein [Dyadobacter fermentans]|nr:DsbA family protein [Dyadobacter fermentans]
MKFDMCYICLACFCIYVSGCERSNNRQIAGEVEGERIYLDEVDGMITNSLYEYLFAISETRIIAANELINLKVLKIEAGSRRISVDSLLSMEMRRISMQETKLKYIRDNALQGGVVDERNPFKLHPLDTPAGAEILNNSYQKFLRIRLVDELRVKYRARILLSRPQPPQVDLTNVTSHARGNLKALHSVTIVSDFDCPVCREAYPELSKLFERYSDHVRFEAISLSSSVTPPILFAECAAKQQKFWEVYGYLYGQKGYDFNIDSLIAQFELNREECKSCLESRDQHKIIETDMNRLRQVGIEVTPTVLIDHRVYHGPLTDKAIGRFLDDLFKETPNPGN